MINRGLPAAALMVAAAALAAGCGGSSSPRSDPRTDAGRPDAVGADVGGGGGMSGSGGSSGGSGGFVGSGGSAGSADAAPSTDGAAGDAAADVAANCAVRLDPVSVSSFFDEIEAGPMSVFRLRATVLRPGPRMPRWSWRVTDASSAPVSTTAVGGDPAIVEFPIKNPGNYSVQADVETGLSCAPGFGIARVIAPRPASFTVRVTPPETSDLPVQDNRLVLAGTSFTPTRLDLLPGSRVTLATTHDVDVKLPAYVRISSAASRVSIEGHTGRRPVEAVLLPLVTYDVLLVPDGPFAPMLLSNTPGLLPRTIPFNPGTLVTGRALDGAGQPVADARIVLRAGARPSTVGRSDASGAFELLTLSGTMSAEINAPDGLGLPNLRVAAVPGVVLQDGAGLDLTVRWAASTTAALRIAVSSTDGAAAVAGAVVRVESTAASAETLGQLSVRTTGASGPAEVILPAGGAVKVEAATNVTGTANFPALPAGAYRVTVIPLAEAAAAMAATTTANLELPAAGLTRSIRLARKVRLSGTLLPSAVTAGVRVTAIDDETRTSITTTAAAGGRYELLLDPGRSYRLWAQPAPAQPLGRAVLGSVTAGSADGVIPDRAVPRGIVFDGRVASGGSPVNGALIQVFCAGTTAACADPDLPVADAVSGVDGAFRLMLPDPGAAQN